MAVTIDLSGQTAIVTGGARGIGKATCLLLAEAGAQVLLNDIRPYEAARPTLEAICKAGGRAEFIQADVSVQADAQRISEAALRAFGKIDILVNNAGVSEDWDRTMAVNANGPFYCSIAVLPHMVERGRGRIVNISSTCAISGSTGAPAYVASKGACFSLTRYLAREYAPKGVLVNGIMPAVIKTDMLRMRYPTDEEIDAQYIHRVPVRRVGLPEDIAGIVLFLCSKFSTFISGEVIVADGGRLWGS